MTEDIDYKYHDMLNSGEIYDSVDDDRFYDGGKEIAPEILERYS